MYLRYLGSSEVQGFGQEPLWPGSKGVSLKTETKFSCRKKKTDIFLTYQNLWLENTFSTHCKLHILYKLY